MAQGAFDPVFAVTTYTNYSSSDYNGYRSNPNVADSFEWNSPAVGVAAAFGQTTVDRRYANLSDFTEATGQEQHSVLVDYDVFARVPKPDPADPQHVYTPEGSILAYGPAPQLLMPASRCRR